MQLDTEDGDTFVPPAGVVASPTTERPDNADDGQGDSEARAAAEATREMEE